MRRAASHRSETRAAEESTTGAPDTLDAQIDDLLANIETETEPAQSRPGKRRGGRRFTRTRRLAHRTRRLWALRRTTALLAAALLASTGIAVATVYLAAQLLG